MIVPAPSSDNFLRTIASTADCFRSRRIPYAIIGAWALAVWGRPRATQDLDFLVMVKDLQPVKTAMARGGMTLDDAWLHHNPMLRGWQARAKKQGITVDILRARDSHDSQIFKRRRRKRLANRYFWFVAPEDFILQKLKVGRPKDFEDAMAVLARSGRLLDRGYLARWASRLGVTEELNYVLSR